MQTKQLALLSTMLVGLGGVALAAETTDAAKNSAKPAVEQVEQQAGAAADATMDAAGDVADQVETTASDATEAAEDALAPDRARSIGTSGQTYAGEVFAGMTADDVIGMPVVDAQGQTVGEVTDLLIGQDGTVDRAIVDVGGFFGFATKSVAFDVTSLTVAEGDGEIVSDVTEETLEEMPEWQQDDSGWFSS